MSTSKCSLKDGILEACFGLNEILNGPDARSGVKVLPLRNLTTLAVVKEYVTVYSGKHKKNGVVFNFCPFCGERVLPS